MEYTRRSFLESIGMALACASLGDWSFAGPRDQLNILFFTADDMDCDSVGCFGGMPQGLTPNLDQFARQGMRFERAHVNVAICMPSRIVLGTGLYSHSSGAMGFMHARAGTPSITGLFQKAGYLAGVLGKVEHSTPCVEDRWDYSFDRPALGDGRNPGIYYQRCKTFFDLCKQKNKPFYLMVNSHDPHRPFHVAGRRSRGSAEPSRTYRGNDVTVPGYLPDLQGVRRELSQYLNSARRLDDTFGKVMQALRESGFERNTLVMFLSDNGIAVPFAKCNCYLSSTRTPWIVRWPGVVRPGTADRTNFISGVDFLPTVLEAAGLPRLRKQDGQSFVPLLKGKAQKGRDFVFTQIDSKAGNGFVPMRCIQNGKYGYIFNAWSDGKYKYRNNNEGQCMRAMETAAKTDKTIAERVRMFRYRALEELYDMEKDPACLHNLIADPRYRPQQADLTRRLDAWMVATKDPLREAFLKRNDASSRKQAMRKARRAGSQIGPR